MMKNQTKGGGVRKKEMRSLKNNIKKNKQK